MVGAVAFEPRGYSVTAAAANAQSLCSNDVAPRRRGYTLIVNLHGGLAVVLDVANALFFT